MSTLLLSEKIDQLNCKRSDIYTYMSNRIGDISSLLNKVDIEKDMIKTLNNNLDKLDHLNKQATEMRIGNASRIVFNVGGTLFTTSYQNVTKEPSILNMVCHLQFYSEQPFFIDRDPECFDIILKYFRNDFVSTKELSERTLLYEAEFYEIHGLITKIQETTKVTSTATTSKTDVKNVETVEHVSEGTQLMDSFENDLNEIEKSIELEMKTLQSTQVQKDKLQRYFGWSPHTIDVGGKKFQVSKNTLNALKDVFTIEKDGSYFIDRSPEEFHNILKFVRNQNISTTNRKKLINDGIFYGLDLSTKLANSIIYFQELFNIVKTDNGVFSGNFNVAQFNRNAKSNVMFSGRHSLSLRLKSVSKTIMIGVGDSGANIKANDIYNTTKGKFYYSLNKTIYGLWQGCGTIDVSGIPGINSDDEVTLNLDIDAKTLSISVNHSSDYVICKNFPSQENGYCFYVILYQNTDSFEIV